MRYGAKACHRKSPPEEENVMTVERALRALAGGFVLSSVALGFWIHPGFLVFTAFVGTNLLQSAFTNWCPAMWIFRKMGLRDGESAKAAAGCASETMASAR
jgi:hypothetical protein